MYSVSSYSREPGSSNAIVKEFVTLEKNDENSTSRVSWLAIRISRYRRWFESVRWKILFRQGYRHHLVTLQVHSIKFVWMGELEKSRS